MYRIKFFSSFCDSTNCKNVYERLCEVDKMDNYGPNKDIYIVNDDEPYTHAIILNTDMPLLNIPKENVIGLAFEPPDFLGINESFIEYVKKNVNKYFIGVSNGLPNQFIEHYSYMWHITPPKEIYNKTKLCSIMISNKIHTYGHKYRHAIVNIILQSNLPIDIYGTGCCYYNINDNRLKGEFIDNEPYQDYQFHICIENFQTNSYMSEKYTNTLLSGTIPIYLGASNIMFKDLTINLSGNLEYDINLIKNITETPNNYIKHISQNEIRNKINLLKNLDTIFNN